MIKANENFVYFYWKIKFYANSGGKMGQYLNQDLVYMSLSMEIISMWLTPKFLLCLWQIMFLNQCLLTLWFKVNASKKTSEIRFLIWPNWVFPFREECFGEHFGQNDQKLHRNDKINIFRAKLSGKENKPIFWVVGCSGGIPPLGKILQ